MLRCEGEFDQSIILISNAYRRYLIDFQDGLLIEKCEHISFSTTFQHIPGGKVHTASEANYVHNRRINGLKQYLKDPVLWRNPSSTLHSVHPAEPQLLR